MTACAAVQYKPLAKSAGGGIIDRVVAFACTPNCVATELRFDTAPMSVSLFGKLQLCHKYFVGVSFSHLREAIRRFHSKPHKPSRSQVRRLNISLGRAVVHLLSPPTFITPYIAFCLWFEPIPWWQLVCAR